MATQKKIYNIYGNEINKIQLSSLSDYSLKTIVDNKLKMVEHFEDKLLADGEYYLEDNENIDDLIQEYCINKKQRWYFHFNKQTSGIFTLWDWKAINSDGIAYFKGKRVLDNKNRKVFYCQLNLETEEIKGEAIKIAYQNIHDDENTDILFKFKYNADGSLFRIEDPNEIYFDKVMGSKPQDFIDDIDIQAFFSWNEHEYYHSALPFLPNENIK